MIAIGICGTGEIRARAAMDTTIQNWNWNKIKETCLHLNGKLIEIRSDRDVDD